MNIGVAQIRGALLQFFMGGKVPFFYLCRTLPSISKITLDYNATIKTIPAWNAQNHPVTSALEVSDSQQESRDNIMLNPLLPNVPF